MQILAALTTDVRFGKFVYRGFLCETDGLLLFRSKSIIFQTIDLELVIEKAENIFNFYLDFNWEFLYVEFQIN